MGLQNIEAHDHATKGCEIHSAAQGGQYGRVPPNVKIRSEGPEDAGTIAAAVEAAFGSPAEARLVSAIRESENFVPELSLVAEVDGAIVGHVMISYAALDTGDGLRPIAMLSPLAVTPGFQGRGIAAALIREAIVRADDRGEPVVVLEGSPAFYFRFGFEPAARHGIHLPLPSWAPPEAAQVLRLENYRGPSLRGKVIYPPAFDDVSER